MNTEDVIALDLSGEKLIEIPEEIKVFQNLQYLDLRKNKLTEIPIWFQFTDLRILFLDKNKFELFPTQLCTITSLRKLTLGKNKINEIPVCISQLTSLQHLELWFNPLIDLPEEIYTLRNLRYVDLRGIFFDPEYKKILSEKMPWVRFDFESGCDCGN